MASPDIGLGRGSGSRLPLAVLALAGVSAVLAVVVSGVSISLQLGNYRKPLLQRAVVRIMVMVPLYAVASLISLFSLEAAFFIDVVRDVYEAFVIYSFFVLLLDYLGGERSLLILLHGRPPIPAVFPLSLWRTDIDPSDPYTFLFLKRGILQYVQVKPLLALASLIMKATGTYNEGDFRARSGYLYLSIVYNISICLALWSLAVFWMCVHDDLRPFRPVPKFLCVKGILFFSFWQSIAVSFLVAVGVITRLGPYTDSEHISLGLTDTLICIEMPFFAAAHMYAFSYRDFIRPPASATGKVRSPMYVARMALGYALRDALGLKDLVEDTRATLRGEGINYRAFEPSEGGMHIGAARDRRIRAGLRYAAGGKRKYWLPETRGVADDDVTAPLFTADPDDNASDVAGEDEYGLTFSDVLAGPEGADDLLYEDAKKYVFGDYLYPVVDVSSEQARKAMREEEERVVREIVLGRAGAGGPSGYGATQNGKRQVRTYEDEDDAPPRDAAHSPWSGRTPEASPRQTSEAKPTPSSSSQPSRTYLSPRPYLPHRLSASSAVTPPTISRSVSASATPSVSSSPRISKRAGHAPLVEEDAVDLVVAADVPTASRAPRSPHSPVLIRVWDEVESDEGLERAQHGTAASGVQRPGGIAVEAAREHVVKAQTPAADVLQYGSGTPEEVDDHNPWA